MRTRIVLAGLVAALVLLGLSGVRSASATVPPDQGITVDTLAPDPNATVPASTVPVDPGTGLPPALGPLVVLPAGCVVPALPLAVFEGDIAAAVTTTARFTVTRLLSGSLDGYEVGGQVDVLFGDETRFLEVGHTYIVGVAPSAATGALVSTVREPAPLFGGDAVVGANDSDVDCVTVDDGVRTVLPDGRAVDTGVLAPLRGSGESLLGAVLRPLAVAFGILLALVLVKQLVFAIGRSLREMGDTAPVSHTRRHTATDDDPAAAPKQNADDDNSSGDGSESDRTEATF